MPPFIEHIGKKGLKETELTARLTNSPIIGRRRKRSEIEVEKHFELNEKLLFVGRSAQKGNKLLFEADDIVAPLFSKALSRTHALFKEEKGRIFLRDLSSRNGTFVNDVKMNSNEDRSLKDGDTIRFGPSEKDGIPSELVFRYHENSKIKPEEARKQRINKLVHELKEELDCLNDIDKSETLNKLALTNQADLDASSLTFSGLDPESIKKELCCAICREIYLFAHVLPCGHTFCKKCIDRWLTSNLSCPLCRVSATNVPIPSKKIDDFVQILVAASASKLVPLYSSDDTSYASDSSKFSLKSIPSNTQSLSLNKVKEKIDNLERESTVNYESCSSTPLHVSFAQRKKEYERECEKAKKKGKTLAGLLSKVQNIGYRFVDATKPWSTREQDRFLHGLRTYSGVARVAYCDSVSLNEDFIGRASIAELKTVCVNLKVFPVCGTYAVEKEEDVDYENWIEKDTRNVRTRLKMFIYYC